MKQGRSPIFRFDDFEADTHARELYRGGTKIKIYGQPFEILTALLERPGEVITREELRQRLWPMNTFVDFERVLNTSVMRLRSALGDSASEPRYVETLPRVGYRFLASVLGDGSEPARRAGVTISAHMPVDNAEPVTNEMESNDHDRNEEQSHPEVSAIAPSASRLISVAMTGAVMMVAVVALGLAVGGWWKAGRSQTPLDRVIGKSLPKARPTIAILGFKNVSGQADEAWLSTAFSEMLTTELGATETLRVIPTQDVATMKASRSLPDSEVFAQEFLQKVRSDSGADAVVLGSYTALGKQASGEVRLDVQVEDTGSGEIRAHLSVTGTEAKLFPMVAQVGSQLRAKLGAGAVGDEGASLASVSLPENPEAARLYSEGLSKLRGFHPREARDLLARAAQIEPKFAIGHSALSAAWMVLGYDDNAREEARKAVELSAALSREERLLVEERYREQTKEWSKAAEIAGALHTFYPDRVDYGIWAARMETLAGKPEDALATLRELQQLPAPAPSDPLISLTEAQALQELGNLPAALDTIRQAEMKCLAIDAKALEPNIVLEEGSILADAGDLRTAATALERAEQLFGAMADSNGAARAVTQRAAISAREGRPEEARRLYERALAMFRSSSNTRAVAETLEDVATVLQKKGDGQRARAAHEELASLNQRTSVVQTGSRQRILP